MLEAVAAVASSEAEGKPAMHVGIGINAGEVVFGAMGASSRMDFTVIGDAVNLGSRLCSAAAPGEVLVSEAARQAAGELADLQFTPREPIAVKGKREAIPIFTVTRK
jgi:adenylate cyclase